MSIDKTLGQGEFVVLETRTHPKALIKPGLLFLVVVAAFLSVLIWFPENDAKPWALGVVGVVGVVTLVTWVLVPYLRWRHSSYTFTNKRLITREGIITRKGRDIPLFRINDFTYERDLLDRLLGCGTIIVSDATEKAGVVLYDVPRIATVQRQLSELIFQADDGSDDGEFPPTEPPRRR